MTTAPEPPDRTRSSATRGTVYEVTVRERTLRIEVRSVDGGFAVRVDDGPERRVHGGALGPAEWLLHIGEDKHLVGLFVKGDRFDAQIAGHAFAGQVIDARRKALDLGGGAGRGELRTPMPGAVVRVPVAQGDSVHQGQVVVVVEAMKMENEFKAPVAGKVAQVHVRPGQAVEANALLVTLEAEGG